MTKFKVGDRIRNNCNSNYEYGAIGVITDIDEDGDIQTSFKSISGNHIQYYWSYTDWMELIEPTPNTPKTYTLTPYIKPETVTIKGVEYIMTENV